MKRILRRRAGKNKENTTMFYKLDEYTNGNHIYMRMRLDSGRIEEIDVYITQKGIKYITGVDRGINQNYKLRQEIIDAFNKLY